jgi:hypothetical protein
MRTRRRRHVVTNDQRPAAVEHHPPGLGGAKQDNQPSHHGMLRQFGIGKVT